MDGWQAGSLHLSLNAADKRVFVHQRVVEVPTNKGKMRLDDGPGEPLGSLGGRVFVSMFRAARVYASVHPLVNI